MGFTLKDKARRPVEFGTLCLAAAIYGGWISATLLHRWLPAPLAPLLGGWILAWQGSLQHETIHGHPTSSRTVNSLIGRAPLSLWLPYERYRETHLAHHASADLTEPSADPESRYLRERSGFAGALRGVVERCGSTLLGRLTLGPFIEVATFLAQEIAGVARDIPGRRRIWSVHLLEAALVVAWLKLACHMSLLLYAAAFIYPGAALSLLRSFAEHRAAKAPEHRIAIVENAPVLGLLFLNNNLHAVHHRHPAMSWTELPGLYRRRRSSFVSDNGGLVYDGYAEVVRRFLFAPHDDLYHPREVTAAEVC